MKIFIFVVCLSLAQLLNASEIKDGNDVLIAKIVEGLTSLKSSKCQSDLNRTVNAFHNRKPWAVASKNKFSNLAWSKFVETRKKFLIDLHQVLLVTSLIYSSINWLELSIAE